MAPTLEKLRTAGRFANVLRELRGEGWRDWQLLLAVHNVAKNARHKFRAPANERERKAMAAQFMSPEPEGKPIDANLFTADALRQGLRTTVVASAHNWWGLEIRQHPIDADAVLELLRVRYGWASDDIDHDDPFAPYAG